MKSNEGEEECNHFKNAVKRSSYYPYLPYFLLFPNDYLSDTVLSRGHQHVEFKSSPPIQNKQPSLNSLPSVGLKSILSVVTTVHTADIKKKYNVIKTFSLG